MLLRHNPVQPLTLALMDGWMPYWHGCYLLQTTPLSCHDAHAVCQTLGSDLVSFFAASENAHASLMALGHTPYWIGYYEVPNLHATFLVDLYAAIFRNISEYAQHRFTIFHVREHFLVCRKVSDCVAGVPSESVSRVSKTELETTFPLPETSPISAIVWERFKSIFNGLNVLGDIMARYLDIPKDLMSNPHGLYYILNYILTTRTRRVIMYGPMGGRHIMSTGDLDNQGLGLDVSV